VLASSDLGETTSKWSVLSAALHDPSMKKAWRSMAVIFSLPRGR
jgi:hypothetical protein